MLHRGSVRIRRRRSGDEPLVIEKRSTESAMEEIVRDRVMRVGRIMQVSIDGQGRGVVVTHGQPARVAAGDVAILLTVVELVLLLIKLVHDVAGAAARQVVWAGKRGAGGEGDAWFRARQRARRDVALNAERLVG